MTDTKELRRLAEARQRIQFPSSADDTKAISKYLDAVRPSVVLALLDEVEALRKDAERWKYVRDQPFSNDGVPFICRHWNGLFAHWNGSDVEAVVDAALASLASPQPEKEEGNV